VDEMSDRSSPESAQAAPPPNAEKLPVTDTVAAGSAHATVPAPIQPPTSPKQTGATFDRVLTLSAAISSPLLIAVVAGLFAWSQHRESSRLEMLKLAVEVLESPSDSAHRLLRYWATDMLAEASPVPVSRELRELLRDSLSLPPVSIDPAGRVLAIRPGKALIEACTAGICGYSPISVVDSAKPDPTKRTPSPAIRWRVIPIPD
jgi:hypothetical protein